MPSVPPIPGLTRYTRWDQVPDALRTRTQLDREGLKPSPGTAPVLYHGNSYAPLFEKTAAVPKRRTTPAQHAALDRARALQYECRRCGTRRKHPLGKGRWCEPCSYAAAMWEQHEQGQALARELLADPTAVLLVVDVARDALPIAQAVAVVSVRDGETLYEAIAGEPGGPERVAATGRLDAVLADRRVVEETDFMGPPSRSPRDLVYEPGKPWYGSDPAHPWATPECSVAGVWKGWFAWRHSEVSTIASVPLDGMEVPWPRTLDVAADGRAMLGVVQRIADGTEPVWDQATWLLDGHGEPEPRVGRRRRDAGVAA
ncbi:hypothetical protein [Streptomyces sp. NPDC004376]